MNRQQDRSPQGRFLTPRNMAVTGPQTGYTFVVEHLDPELGPWSALEYKTIAQESKKAGCRFILSSVPESLLQSQDLQVLRDAGAEGRNDSIEEYFADRKDRICLLDPAAKQELDASDASQFDIFLFGGILGKTAVPGVRADILFHIPYVSSLTIGSHRR